MPKNPVRRSARPHSLLMLGLVLALALPALAGTPAGVVQDTLKRPAPPPVRTDVPLAPPTAPRPAQFEAAPDGARTVVVSKFQFVGNTRLSDAELQAAVAPFVGRPLSFEQLYEAADALTAAYRAKGYGLATAVVPAQRIDSGTVRLEVIEGVIASIAFEGNSSYSTVLLRRMTSDVKSGQVYTTETVEAAVLRLNDLPGLQARVVVQPSTNYGASDLIFKVHEIAATYAITADNYGRDELGKNRLLFDATWNNLTGGGDDLRLGLVHAEAGLLDYFGLTYSMPLGDRGQRLAFTANYADYAIDDPLLAPLVITGDNLEVRADYSRPLLRSRDQNMVLRAALAHAESETLLGAGPALSSTDLNWLELGLFWNRVFPGQSSFNLSAGYAGNFQSQDPDPADPDGIDSSAMQGKLSIDATFAWPFAASWNLVTRANAAYSNEVLPDIQRFSVGGPYSLRGYDSSAVRGDYGQLLSLELQRGLRAFGVSHVLHAFVETASVGTQEYSIGLIPVPGTSTDLSTAGLGLTINPVGRYSAALNYSRPIDGLNLPDEDGRLWASVTARF